MKGNTATIQMANIDEVFRKPCSGHLFIKRLQGDFLIPLCLSRKSRIGLQA